MTRSIQLGLPHQFVWLRTVLAMVFVMSVLDGVLTVYWVSSAQAAEANPLWASLLSNSPVLFMIAKTSLVGAGCYVLYRYRLRAISVIASFGLFFIYYSLIVYHVAGGIA